MRNEKNGTVLIELDGPVDDAEQPALKAALPLDGGLCPQLDFATGETLEIGKPDQRTLESWRTDFKSIGSQRKDVFVNVERGRHVPAHLGAIVQRHATSVILARLVPVDDDPNHRSTPLALMTHVD